MRNLLAEMQYSLQSKPVFAALTLLDSSAATVCNATCHATWASMNSMWLTEAMHEAYHHSAK